MTKMAPISRFSWTMPLIRQEVESISPALEPGLALGLASATHPLALPQEHAWADLLEGGTRENSTKST